MGDREKMGTAFGQEGAEPISVVGWDRVRYALPLHERSRCPAFWGLRNTPMSTIVSKTSVSGRSAQRLRRPC